MYFRASKPVRGPVKASHSLLGCFEIFAILLSLSFVVGRMAPSVLAAEQDAIEISNNIQQLHMPNGTILDPIFASPTSDTIVGYTRGGDSAIWTGHYLAAEAFRYKVTGSPDALANVWTALNGIRSLRVVTGTDVLARCLVLTDWQFASSITTEEASHGVFKGTVDGKSYKWIGGTSRDQYSGVFFGLGVAYDMVDDASVRSFISNEVTSLLNFLLRTGWTVIMPNFSISTTFIGRPDQQLSLLQVGRHVNPGRFESTYESYRSKYASLVKVPLLVESLDNYDSYFKFNLDEINLYNLIRLEDVQQYRKQYMKGYKAILRAVRSHENAHFNMIDRALRGPDPARDADTAILIEAWLERPRRDVFVDNTGKFPACGTNRACSPIPVPNRVTTDFLWQREPFDITGGGAGTIESAGIDYILPYWMERYYSSSVQ